MLAVVPSALLASHCGLVGSAPARVREAFKHYGGGFPGGKPTYNLRRAQCVVEFSCTEHRCASPPCLCSGSSGGLFHCVSASEALPLGNKAGHTKLILTEWWTCRRRCIIRYRGHTSLTTRRVEWHRHHFVDLGCCSRLPLGTAKCRRVRTVRAACLRYAVAHSFWRSFGCSQPLEWLRGALHLAAPPPALLAARPALPRASSVLLCFGIVSFHHGDGDPGHVRQLRGEVW